MKILNTEVYTTTILHGEYDNEYYKVTHREDGDGYFVPVWHVENKDGEEVWEQDTRKVLIEWAKKYLV
jgi:hypothetical protein